MAPPPATATNGAPQASAALPKRAVLAAFVLPVLFSLAMAPLFASGADPDYNAPRLRVAVASFEPLTAHVASAFSRFVSQLGSSGAALPTFVWHEAPATSPQALTDLVDMGDTDYWAAVWIDANASAALTDLLANPGHPGAYDPAHALHYVWDEARNNLMSTTRVGGAVRALLSTFIAQFGSAAITSLQGQGGGNETLLTLASVAPSLLLRPIAFTERNLHPFNIPVGTCRIQPSTYTSFAMNDVFHTTGVHVYRV